MFDSKIRLLLCLMITGLPSHPQHELAKRQCTGCPGMVTFYIKGTLQHAETFLKNLKVNFQISCEIVEGKSFLQQFILSQFHPTQINVFVPADHTHKPFDHEMHWVRKWLGAVADIWICLFTYTFQILPSVWEGQNVLVHWFSHLFKSKPFFQMKYEVKPQSSVQWVQYTKTALKSSRGVAFQTLCLPGCFCLGEGREAFV